MVGTVDQVIGANLCCGGNLGCGVGIGKRGVYQVIIDQIDLHVQGRGRRATVNSNGQIQMCVILIGKVRFVKGNKRDLLVHRIGSAGKTFIDTQFFCCCGCAVLRNTGNSNGLTCGACTVTLIRESAEGDGGQQQHNRQKQCSYTLSKFHSVLLFT